MRWLRLDGRFDEHEKVMGLTDRQFAAHVRALLYATRNETKGVVKRNAFRKLRVTSAIESALVKAQLWEQNADGSYTIHAFEIYNGVTLEDRVRAYLAEHPEAPANEVYRVVGGQRAAVLALVEKLRAAGSETVPGNQQDGPPGGSEAGSAEPPAAGSREPPTRARAFPTPPQKEPVLTADRSETRSANGLPIAQELLTTRLLTWIGDHGDDKTPTILRLYAAQLPEAGLARVLESTEGKRPRNRAGYVVAALKSELDQLQAARDFEGEEPS